MRILFMAALLLGVTLHAGINPAAGVFEEARDNIWRTKAAGREILILPTGFIVRHGERSHRFRWSSSMNLESLVAEEPASGHSYELSIDGGRELSRAHRIRATSVDGQLSIVYYFGARGFEFDIELALGIGPAGVALESIDGDFSLGANGRVSVDDMPLLLKPVAYAVSPSGDRRHVAAEYRFETARRLGVETGEIQPDERLVIDPVMTYATYFAGSGDDTPVAMKELPDGSLIIAGNSSSADLPRNVSLTGIFVQPLFASNMGRCFVTRLSPATKEIHFTSYLGLNSPW